MISHINNSSKKNKRSHIYDFFSTSSNPRSSITIKVIIHTIATIADVVVINIPPFISMLLLSFFHKGACKFRENQKTKFLRSVH